MTFEVILNEKEKEEVRSNIEGLTGLALGLVGTSYLARNNVKGLIDTAPDENYAILALKCYFYQFMSEVLDGDDSDFKAFTASFLLRSLDLVDWYSVLAYYTMPEQLDNKPF